MTELAESRQVRRARERYEAKHPPYAANERAKPQSDAQWQEPKPARAVIVGKNGLAMAALALAAGLGR